MIGTSSMIGDGLGCIAGDSGGAGQGGAGRGGDDGGGTVWIGDMVGVVVGLEGGGAVERGRREGEGNGDGIGGGMNEADSIEVRRVSTVVWRLSLAVIERGW